MNKYVLSDWTILSTSRWFAWRFTVEKMVQSTTQNVGMWCICSDSLIIHSLMHWIECGICDQCICANEWNGNSCLRYVCVFNFGCLLVLPCGKCWMLMGKNHSISKIVCRDNHKWLWVCVSRYINLNILVLLHTYYKYNKNVRIAAGSFIEFLMSQSTIQSNWT